MDILGIGNALIDIFCFSDDETALSLGLHPNQAIHVTSERLDELLLAVPSRISVSGGSASNTVKAAAALGASCAFVGCVGTEDRERDLWGQIFARELLSFGVQCVLENRTETSGRCLVLHMPGGLKSIACAPGAAPTLHPRANHANPHFSGQNRASRRSSSQEFGGYRQDRLPVQRA